MWSSKISNTCATILAALSVATLGGSTALAQSGLYWADVHFSLISDSNLDGTNAATLVPGVSLSLGLAIDEAAGHLYWTDIGRSQTLADRGDETIRLSNLDGSGVQTILTAADGLRHPANIEIDPIGAKIYWSDPGWGGRIYRANFDGSNVELFLDTIPMRATNYGTDFGGTTEFAQV